MVYLQQMRRHIMREAAVLCIVMYIFNIPSLSFGGHHDIEKKYQLPKKGTYENTVRVILVLATASETRLENNGKTFSYIANGMPDLVACVNLVEYAKIYYKTDIAALVKIYG
jgi:hypothetical protein